MDSDANRNQESAYVNLDCVVGSAAEVERLWSMANCILTNQRKSLAPVMLEALLFLKHNREHWDEGLVMEAHRAARASLKNDRLEKLLSEAGDDYDNEDEDK